MNRTMRRGLLGLIALGFGVVTGFAHGQGYPNKSIRIVVPAPPGGATDHVARLIGQKLSEAWGQPVIVDNRGGAAGNVGVAIVAKSPPDGYTLLVPTSSFPTSPSLYSKLPFDTIKDFAPISLLVVAPQLLVVNTSVPATSVEELIALAKAKPGQLNFANSGSGTTAHLAGELFKKMAGVDLVSIAYKGAGPASMDLIAGQVQIMFMTIPASIQQIKAGKLRALAVSSSERVPVMPSIPTVAEAGLPGFDVVVWLGLFAPAGVPRPIITKLNKEVVNALRMPEMRELFAGQGLIPASGTPEELGKFLKFEIGKWATVIKEAGIKAQ